MPLPQYFQPGEVDGQFYHSVGDRVYGTLTVQGVTVHYRFNDGSKPYEDKREFKSESAAQKFASKFGAYMNQCGKRNTVPHLGTFREFS